MNMIYDPKHYYAACYDANRYRRSKFRRWGFVVAKTNRVGRLVIELAAVLAVVTTILTFTGQF